MNNELNEFFEEPEVKEAFKNKDLRKVYDLVDDLFRTYKKGLVNIYRLDFA